MYFPLIPPVQSATLSPFVVMHTTEGQSGPFSTGGVFFFLDLLLVYLHKITESAWFLTKHVEVAFVIFKQDNDLDFFLFLPCDS